MDKLDETVKYLVSTNADLKCLSGSKLCSLLLKQGNDLLDGVVVRCAELVAWGYLARLEDDAVSEMEEVTEISLFSFSREYGLSELLRPHTLNARRFPLADDSSSIRSHLELSAICYSQLRDAWLQSRSNKQKVLFTSLPMWKRFSEMLLVLQRVSLTQLTDEALVAFLVNVHNTLFLHAWIVHRDVFPAPETAALVGEFP